MVEFTLEQETEIQKRIMDNRVAQMQCDFGQQWFIESLAHSEDLVTRNLFPKEAHQMGIMFQRQFRINSGLDIPTPAQHTENKSDIKTISEE